MKLCSLFQDIFHPNVRSCPNTGFTINKIANGRCQRQKELCRVLAVTLLKEEKNKLINKPATPMNILLIDEDQNYYFSPTKDA